MEVKHEILLEQMLEELRAQTRALQELHRRLDEMERALTRSREVANATVDVTDR